MAVIDDLIAQVDDPALRKRLQTEIARANKQKKFGLVFEEHLPECTPLYEVPVKEGRLVARQTDISNLYIVEHIANGEAVCISRATKERETIPLTDLVSVAEFGDPIYPYLEPIDKVENAPGSDLWHTLIEADNYHALQLLEYLYAGQVSCIYIDPPYNTGAKEWKYNDSYIDSNDMFMHSKWLSFMKKRIQLCKRILSKTGIIIISIGYQELNELVLLCKECFPNKQVVFSTVQTSSGKPNGGFTFTNEYLVFVAPEDFCPNETKDEQIGYASPFHALTLATFDKTQRPNQVYPIWVDATGHIVGCGKSLAEKVKTGEYQGKLSDFQYDYAEAPKGSSAVWPVTKKNEDCVWRLIPQRLLHDWKKGYIKVTRNNSPKSRNKFNIQFLSKGIINKIESGELKYSTLEDDTPTLDIINYKTSASTIPLLLTNKEFFTSKGSNDIKTIFDAKLFTYPKPVALIKYLLQKATHKNSLIIDFFAGSGTTLHAVNLLNAEDGGHRRCIMVTNNEVSDAEAKALKKQGYKPTDAEWQRLGIARYVTWPRTVCTIEGHDVNGQPLKGTYLGSDRPMADGFPANAAFFHLGFLDKHEVARGEQLAKLIPVLWMKAGAIGPCPAATDAKDMMIFPRNKFAILMDTKYTYQFTKAVAEQNIEVAFIITDYEPEYRSIAQDLTAHTTYQLYRDYLENFTINMRRL